MSDANHIGLRSPVPPQPVPPPRKRGCGCGLMTGCLLLLLALMIAGLGGLYFAFHRVRDFATDTQPRELVLPEITDADRRAASEKVEMLAQAIDNNQVVTAELTAMDLNALAAKDQPLEYFVFGMEENDQVAVDFSVPLHDLPGFKGRWLNGAMTMNVSCTNGILEVYPAEIAFKGQTVPGSFMKEFRKQNLASKVYENADARELLKHINRIRVEDGRLLIRTSGE